MKGDHYKRNSRELTFLWEKVPPMSQEAALINNHKCWYLYMQKSEK